MRGGTNAAMAPQIDFTELVFAPIAKRMGVHFQMEVIKRGYYPKGGGIVHLTVPPLLNLIPIEIIEFGDMNFIHIRSYVAALPRSVFISFFTIIFFISFYFIFIIHFSIYLFIYLFIYLLYQKFNFLINKYFYQLH